MEEADQLLILTLRQIGCDLPDECTGCHSIGTNELVRTVSHVLSIIGVEDMPTFDRASLPREMSGKFKACTALAEAVIKLGFKDECGFHQFLYPSPKITREIITFVTSKLPQSEAATGAELISGANEAMFRGIAASLRQASAASHTPVPCRPRSLASSLSRECWHTPKIPVDTARLGSGIAEVSACRGPHSVAPSLFEAAAVIVESRRDAEEEAGWEEDVSVRRERFDRAMKGAFRSAGGAGVGGKKETLMQVMAEWTCKGVGSKSRFGRAADFGRERGDADGLASDLTREERMKLAEEERNSRFAKEQQERDDAIAMLNNKLVEYAAAAADMSEQLDVQSQHQRQLHNELESEAHRSEELMGEYRRKKQALMLLKDRDANISRLQEESAASAKGLVELAAEWERHRLPLIEALRSKKSELSRRKGDMLRKAEAVKMMRAEMRQLSQEVSTKDELAKSLGEEYAGMNKAVQRGSYTRKIMDIVKNIDKQDRDIQSILSDTRNIQKEINTCVEALNTAYGATDHMVYRDAQKGDSAAKKMYKELVGMHECFERLSKAIAESGEILSMVRDIEIKIEQESNRASVLNLEAVRKDFADISMENEALRQRVGA